MKHENDEVRESAQYTKAKAKGGRVPRLRFPEFTDEEMWDEYTLGDIADKLYDGDWIEAADQVKNGIWLIQTGNIGVGEFIPKNESRHFISKETFERLRCTEVFPNDCLISRLPDPAGRSCLVPNTGVRMITAVDCTIIRFKTKIILPYIFILFSQTDRYFAIVRNSCSGSTRQRISRENLIKIKIKIPGIFEQRKIAACLSSLDELIAVHGRKLEALVDYKRGLMQQLFPEEGKSVPRIRFPEFEDAEEWYTIPLGKAGKNLDNRRIPITESDRPKGDIPYYGASGIVDYVKEYIFDEIILCISEDGANLVSRTYPIAFSISGKSWVNNHAHVMRFENESTRIVIENYLNSIDLSDYLTGMAQPKLNQAMLDVIPIPLPQLIEEQVKIASTLSSLDDLIAAEKRKLQELEEHKRGLMQGLFPAPEEDE